MFNFPCRQKLTLLFWALQRTGPWGRIRCLQPSPMMLLVLFISIPFAKLAVKKNCIDFYKQSWYAKYTRLTYYITVSLSSTVCNISQARTAAVCRGNICLAASPGTPASLPARLTSNWQDYEEAEHSNGYKKNKWMYKLKGSHALLDWTHLPILLHYVQFSKGLLKENYLDLNYFFLEGQCRKADIAVHQTQAPSQEKLMKNLFRLIWRNYQHVQLKPLIRFFRYNRWLF